MDPSKLPTGIERIDDGTTPTPMLVDREQAFLLYATFCGDLVRTAHSLGVSPVAVLRMVDDGGWNERLKPILELKNSARPGDIERAINRALNFVQAHRFRMFLETVLRRLTDLTPSQLYTYLEERKLDKEGEVVSVKLSTRALADFASALEKAHSLVYQALGDTATERVKRKEEDNGAGAAVDLHAKIAAAMAHIAEDNSPRALLFEAQIKHAARTGRQDQTIEQPPAAPEPPPHPNDVDN